MKKILCPTDFSDAAFNAIAYAAKFVQATGAELILYHVQSLTERMIQEVIFSNSISTPNLLRELQGISRELSITFKISCYADVEASRETLAKTIERKASDYDLIIMGTGGDDDLFDFLAGSNTYNVIRKSKIPVLVVPPKCTYSRIDKIVYAFNYLRERSLPLEQLIPWIEILKCELTVLQIMEEAQSTEVDNELRELQSIVSDSQSGVQISFDSTRTSNVSEGISTYIGNKGFDALALCTHHKTFLENLFHKSVIRKNIGSQTSNFPLFVFHQ